MMSRVKEDSRFSAHDTRDKGKLGNYCILHFVPVVYGKENKTCVKVAYVNICFYIPCGGENMSNNARNDRCQCRLLYIVLTLRRCIEWQKICSSQ